MRLACGELDDLWAWLLWVVAVGPHLGVEIGTDGEFEGGRAS